MKRFCSILLAVMIIMGGISITTGAMAAGTKVTLVTVDSVSGKTVGSVRVSVWKVDGDTQTCIKEVTTGTNGKKSVTLNAGSYRVTYDAPNGYAYGVSTSFKLAKGAEAQTINVKMNPVYDCKFKVLDSNGKAVKNAQVYVYGAGGDATFFESGNTNSSGVVAISKVMYGSRNVVVYVTVSGKRYKAYSGKIKITKACTKTINLPAKSEWTEDKPLRN